MSFFFFSEHAFYGWALEGYRNNLRAHRPMNTAKFLKNWAIKIMSINNLT